MWQEAPPFRWRQEFHNLPPPPPPPPPPVFSSPSSFEFDTEAEFEPEPEPILIKTFFKFQRHHSQADFAEALSHGIVPSPLTLIQTETMDINLRDITNTIRDQALPPVIRSESNIMLSFAVVYLTAAPAPRQYIVRKVGRTMCNAERIIDDYLMLEDTGFEIGDYLDVAVRFPGGRRRHSLDLFSSKNISILLTHLLKKCLVFTQE